MKRLMLAGLMGVAGTARAQVQGDVMECYGNRIHLNRLAPVWYAPEAQGQGITMLYKDGGLWGYWTLYDDRGQPMWLLFSVDASELDCVMDIQLYHFTGPPYLSEWDDSLVQAEEWDGQPQFGGTYGQVIRIFFKGQNEIQVIHGYGGLANYAVFLDFLPFN